MSSFDRSPVFPVGDWKIGYIYFYTVTVICTIFNETQSYHFLLVVCSNRVSILHRFRDINTCLAYL